MSLKSAVQDTLFIFPLPFLGQALSFIRYVCQQICHAHEDISGTSVFYKWLDKLMWLNQAPDDLIISTSVSLQETLWHILELHFFCYGYNDWWLTFTARFDLHRSLSYLSNSICSPVAVKIMFINPFTDHFDVIEQHFIQFPLPLSWKYLFFLYPVS